MENVKQIKKIDIHAHATAFPEYYPNVYDGKRFVSPEEVIEFYDKLGIEKGVLLPLSAAEGQVTPQTSEACKFLTEKYPERFLWFCNVDPRASLNDPTCDLTGILKFYKSIGAKGVGEITANLYADDPKLENLYVACEALELPITIHIATEFRGYGIYDELGLPRIEKILKNHPRLKVLGHSQAFWCEISADCTEEERSAYPKGKVTEGRIAELLRKYDNLYCDISAGSGGNALMRDPEYAAKFIEEFSDRILYGCDICNATNTHPYTFLDFIENMLDNGSISPLNFKRIMRDNAVRLLNL